MKRAIIFTLAMVLVAMGAVALQAGGPRGSADVVKVTPVTADVTGTAGERINLNLKLNIERKWHIYAHGDTNFIGVDMVPAEGFPLTELQAVYPEGHEGEFFGEKVITIDGKQVIKASALIPADMPKGEHMLNLAVTAQACDDKTCLAPSDIPVAVKLTVK